MKNIFLCALTLVCAAATGQEHYSGINTSQRGGIINAGVNPAELVNLDARYDIHVFSLSARASNSELGFSDLIGSSDFSSKLFESGHAVDLRIHGEITGPSVAFKMDKWGFAFISKAHAKLDLVDVDPNLGDALTSTLLDSFITSSATVSSNSNQRLNGTGWGEIGLSAARNLYEDERHKINFGATFKILFPGSYANFGADQFHGTITNTLGDLKLTNAEANLNIAYSGNLGENFSNFSDYTSSLFGKPGGIGADFGFNYRLKDNNGAPYRLNVGMSVKNLGSMKFRSSNNSETNYALRIEGAESLNLNQFQNAKSLKEVESILLASGYLNKTVNEHKTFKVNLPAMFTGYADLQIVPSFFITAYTQFKLRKDDENAQIAGQNTFSLTPRYTIKNYEVYLPIGSSEFSGFSTGIGFRAYGFFVGSGSIITALASDAKSADAYIGYGFQLD